MEDHKVTSDDVRAALEKKDFSGLRNFFRDLDTPDVAEIFNKLDISECIVMFRLIPKLRRTDVFTYMMFERQEEMLDQLPDEVVVSILNEMEPSDRTKLFEDLPDTIVTKLLHKLTPKERLIAKQLLSYPEGSVGRLMSPEFIALKTEMNVRDSLDFIRWHAADFPESALHHLFVVDDEGKLLGHMSLANLVMADPATLPVDRFMETTQLALMAYDDETAIADFFRKYDRLYIPVLDDQGVLVGIVEAEDAFDVAEEEATEDIQQFGGQATLEDSYFQTSFLVLLRKRAGWLSLLFLGSMFTANALERFDGVIKSMSYIVYFLPLVIASGGNSGSQAASLMIRGLAVREVVLKDWFKVLSREVFVGIMLGLILGGLGFTRAFLGGQGALTGLVLSASLIGVVTFGAIVGSMLPFLLKFAHLDPAVCSSPMISSLVDSVGILLFFNIAITILQTWAP